MHTVWPFQAAKSHSSVRWILEVCNKRRYWAYMGILIQWREFKFSQIVTFYKCSFSLEYLVNIQIDFQSEPIDICILHVLHKVIIFLFQNHLEIIRIRLTKNPARKVKLEGILWHFALPEKSPIRG